jgi:hypothetical protein
MPAKLPPFDLREAEATLEEAMAANREAQRRGEIHPYGAGALLVMQHRVRDALAATERVS